MTLRSPTLQSLAALASITLLSAVGYVVAFLLRFDWQIPPHEVAILQGSVGVAVAAKLAAALWLGVHRGWNRCVTFHDLLTIAKAASAASAGLTLVDALVLSWANVPRSVILLDWGATLLLLAAARCVPRLLRDARWRLTRAGGVRALIVGAGDDGEALVRMLRTNLKLNYAPVGFVDDGSRRRGERIGGFPVLGRLDRLAEIAAAHHIAEVLITAGELPGRVVRDVVQQAAEAGIRVKMLPSFEQLLGDQLEMQPRPVAIADLLRRPAVELDDAAVRQWTAGRTVLVTGAAGSIGSEICRQLLTLAPAKLLLVDRAETALFFLERELQAELARPGGSAVELAVALADVADADRMSAVFDEHRPEVVFHAAAYKHVPLMESHPGEAVKNIVLATRRLADLADEFGCAGFVMISTDKAVNPTSVMGACKRLAEQYVEAKAASSACRFVTVRFGNVLDSAGSVAPIFREQIARGGPVTVTHPDMVRYFMMIPEAAQLVLQAGAMGRGGEIFVLDMGDPVRIVDLARDMIRLSGLRVGDDVEIQFTGLRPGEKLFEELYGDAEQRRPTAHPKIMAAIGSPRRLLEVIYDIGRLEAEVNAPNDVLRAMLREMAPPYAGENSRRDPARVKLRRAA
jgi:FlaA1/EpsC-like NDP-sugar epimerase